MPVLAGRGASVGQRGDDLGDLAEREPHLLGDADERHPTDHLAVVSALAARRPLGVDQPLLLVEAQRRRGDARAPAEVADRQVVAARHRISVTDGTGHPEVRSRARRARP